MTSAQNNMTLKKAAISYARRERPVFPLRPQDKRPKNSNGCSGATSNAEQVGRWWEMWPGCNIGLATGKEAGVFVLDVDPKQGGPAALRSLEDEHGNLPKTLTARTPSGGWHYYFSHPDNTEVRNSSSGIAPGLDIRGQGGYVVAPPSTTPGGKYEWENKAPIALPPEWLLALIRERAKAPPKYRATMEGGPIPAGQRNSTLASLAGKLRRDGFDVEMVYACAAQVNEQRCNPPLLNDEVRRIAESVGRYPVGDATGTSTNGHGKASNEVLYKENIGITKLLADAILKHEHFVQDAGGKLYRFTSGVYKQFAERYIKRRVKELLEEWSETKKWSSHRASEVAEYIRADALELWEKPPLDEINVKNGILNIWTRELREHDPAFLSTVQIPVAYDSKAKCPEWDSFVQTTFPEDAQCLAYEIPADLMTPERSIQKSILLIGEGSNGKSTYLAALSAFVGSTNVVGLSLQKMESDRFSASRLLGRLANICPDLPSSHLTGTSMFKAVTGGDRINAEYKYKESFEFTPFARLVFSANQVPRSEDASHAFFRRWLVLPFERTFEESEQIPRQQFDAKLAEPKELSGVLNKALDALPSLRETGFTESQKMREAWDEFRQMTDPVSVWLDRNTVEHPDAYVPRTELWQKYNEHVEHAKMTQKAFSQALKRSRPGLDERQVTISGKRVWCCIGIALRSSEPDPPDAQGAQGAQDATNCFVNEVSTDNTDAKGREYSEITNKGNPVHPVHPVHGAEGFEQDSYRGTNLWKARQANLEECHHGTIGGCRLCREQGRWPRKERGES